MVDTRPHQGEKAVLDPARLTLAEIARLLQLNQETLERHLAEGVPRNPDGTINLVHYGAWLNAKMGEEDYGEA